MHSRQENSMAYTCREYRDEMRLLALRRQLANQQLSKAQRQLILDQIRKLEKEMDMT